MHTFVAPDLLCGEGIAVSYDIREVILGVVELEEVVLPCPRGDSGIPGGPH